MREIDEYRNLLLQSEKVLTEQWAYAEIKLMTVMTQLDFCAFYIKCNGRADLAALMALVHKGEDTIFLKSVFVGINLDRFMSSRIIHFVITFNSIRSAQKGVDQQCRY